MHKNRGEVPSMWSVGTENEPAFQNNVGVAAARLWCRTASWPTEKEIADEAGVLPETVGFQARGSSLRERLAHIEFEELMRSYRRLRHSGRPARAALEVVARQRVTAWNAIDPCLVYFPLMACIAVRARRDHQGACARAAVDVIATQGEDAPFLGKAN